MFYSHEVLTSRRHGVATVWLVATLGSKSTLKKVDRKELFAVNIPKTCETIVSPEVPMALRLQSNLLYGVTRVYGEQCNYVLKDAQIEQNKIRTLLRELYAAPTNLEAKHKAKPEQLILQDDPNFVPELAWGFDFDPFRSDFDMTSAYSSQQFSILSPHEMLFSALGSEHLDPAIGDIVIPPSASSSVGGAPAFGFGGSVVGDQNIYGMQEEGLLEDPGFAFDMDGNLIEDFPPAVERAPSVHTPAPELRGDALPEEGYNDQPMQDAQFGYEDDALLPFGQDYDMQDVVAFSTREQQPDEGVVAAGEVAESSETTAAAPAQRVRKVRIIEPDVDLELHNRDIARWDNDYLQTMQIATQHKLQYRATALARKNAEFWVLQNGVGGLGLAFGQDSIPAPLQMFSGNALIEAITGLRLNVAGEKHARDEDDQVSDDNERRVRQRSDEREMGRGDGGFATGDVGDNMYDMGDQTIEVGREGPAPLAEHMSSAMPWNRSASARASSVHPHGQGPFSAGGVPSSSVGGPMSFTARGRTISASPLVGRGTAAAPGANLDDYQLLGDDFDFPVHDAGEDARHPLLPQDHEFELFGAAAGVDTQTAGSQTWLRRALDSESGNFLAFVQSGIQEVDAGKDEKERKRSVEFEALLPPADNSHVVAAQGLLHVLTLATKNLLRAEQSAHFGPISLHLL